MSLVFAISTLFVNGSRFEQAQEWLPLNAALALSQEWLGLQKRSDRTKGTCNRMLFDQ